jgi:hypothetical protein
MKYRINENIIWEDTRKVVIYNYPPEPRTRSYMCKVYNQIERNNIGSKEIEGEAIYLENLSIEQQSLFHILGQAQLALSNYQEKHLKEYEITK